ncbi:type II toxin-antitoxin system HicA family toxin [Candidatus Paracaedibacter symbiosus]|uniref:type II toxin-antitoxin system HicA family toxin n=1 Tax=Candidatus Paracaedibacter symbiosus TaxID=244582 RepID=UPI00050943F9|nr:type II toxin-antitoxin system HicA family toxin [Candidatus Paracaedibacter symbiosus]
MKLNIITSLLLITPSFAMEKTDIPAVDYGKSYLADHLTTVSSPLPTPYNTFQPNLSFIQNPERYFRLDKTSSIPLIQQYKEQAKQIYHAHKLYLNDQKTFLERLRQEASAQNNTNLKSLHPWFYKFEDAEIIDRLNFNIDGYKLKSETIDNWLSHLNNPHYTVDDFFENLMVNRTIKLMIREEMKNEDTCLLPATKFSELSSLSNYGRFLSLESIINFRIFDEQLHALFPHISQDCFNKVNAINPEDLPIREAWLIKQDYALMQFLAGKVSVPFDPDTTWELRPREEKSISAYNYSTRKHEDVMIPIIPKEYAKLFNVLYASLAKGPDKQDASFLPEEAKRFQQNRKQANKRLKGRQNAKNKARAQTGTRLIPTKNTPMASQVEQVNLQPISNAASTVPGSPKPSSLHKVKSTPSKSSKPTIPQGGWSLRDQQRNVEAKLKPQQPMKATTNEVLQIEFQPKQPITLSASQYETLQEILNENAPAYRMTFNRVKDLLEAVGIKVERTGGSHAHIHTPGHNIKTLVDIHYGWTDKYGPGTMKSLRTLMQNLSLNNSDFVG